MLFLFDALLPDWWLPACLGLLLGFPLLILAVLAARLRPWYLPQHTAVEPGTLPGEVQRQIQPWLGRLGFVGFVFQGCSRSQDENRQPCYIWRLANAKDRSIAVVRAHFPGANAKPILGLSLFSFLPDGRVIVTADRPTALSLPEHWQASSRRYTTLEAQLKDHFSRLDGLPVMVLPILQIGTRLAAEERAVMDSMVISGLYSPLPECEAGAKPALMGRPKLAWKQLLGLLTGKAWPSGRRSDVAAPEKKGETDFSDKVPANQRNVAEDAEDTLTRFRQLTASKAGMKYYASRIGVTLLTVALCVWAFGRNSPLQMMQIVLGLLAVHEFGHWLMMRIFGFKGMGWMFVPFLNPLDRGRKLHAPGWQQLAVILAGPMPGLLAGIAIMATALRIDLPGWVLDVGAMAVLLNAFHLMPFLPLDGGKVVDLLIFRDLPFLRPLFTAVSGLMVLLAWLGTGPSPKAKPLLYIGLGMLGGLAWDIRMIRVVRGGRRLGWKNATDEDETLRQIFKGIREEGNDGFFSDMKWHRQIEVLLAEVMRKRPGFFLRIFGGGFYLTAWVLGVCLMLGVFAASLSGSQWHRQRMAVMTEEFREEFPERANPATEELAVPFRALEAKSKPGMDTAALDHFDWPSASRVVNGGMVREDTFGIWMNALCTRMEKALDEGRGAEASRRAEMLLHARATMEPAATLRIRRTLWDSELRCYDALEKLGATGQLDEATLARLDARLNALAKNPVPAVENRLLVDGNIWMDGPGSAFDAEALVADEMEPEKTEDTRFWRSVSEHRNRILERVAPYREESIATAALARHWRETKKVGDFPATLPGADMPLAMEADYIVNFCEAHQLVAWRRLTTLSALRLEAFRLKKGTFPHLWSHTIPGGATIQIDRSDNDRPKLVLQDRRDMPKLMPAWMKLMTEVPEPIYHECPLFPGTSLSKK